MVDIYLSNDDLVRKGLPKLQGKAARDGMEYTYQGLVARRTPTQDLQSDVDSHYQNLGILSKLVLTLRLKKLPPRIRAFQEELTERLNNSV
ncbi:hypothetical protein GOV12_05735 [Candidatus Pacearchaeota archaeon]|nr:hypothetical protein [Candidatus Pacearchaeota archaeon]